ncbi:hypothetical protein, partial [Helicobacter canis]|uniref:hypothetical protein n=1 Tax=Helicobacter canis TaxID=29419 RepID=UPI002942C637
MKKFLAILLYISLANADVNIIIEEDILFKNKQGLFSGKMTYQNQVWQAIGSYKVNAQNKVLLSIERFNSSGRLYELKARPSTLKQLKSLNTKLPKGSNVVFKGENEAELRDFAQIVNNQTLEKNQQKQERKKRQQGAATSGSQGNASGSSVGNISVGGSGSTGGGSIPYLPITSSGKETNGNTTTTWSAQYCKVPEFLENAIKLSVIDKDGNCVEKFAVRDDTKCEYRFDFANNKAIKQTQFYYVDNENKVQNVGDCVDLVGKEYQAELYKDDTKCTLDETDKGNDDKGIFYTTQILFRGIDGLIREATDCIAYGNVKEDLVEYKKDDKSKTSRRIVNQYYIDPYTNDKVYINQYVLTDKQFAWEEKACGEWEMDDVALQGKKRTQISFFDNIEGKENLITSCDYSVEGGKQSEYILKYQKIKGVDQEREIKRESKSFSIPKWTSYTTECKSWYQPNWWRTNYKLYGEDNWTSTYITYDVTKYDVYLRPDGSEFKKYADPNNKGETFTETRRSEVVASNGIGTDEKWRTYYEIHSKNYANPTIENSGEYQSWVFSKVGG